MAGIVERLGLFGAVVLGIVALLILNAYAGFIFLACSGIALWRLWRVAERSTVASLAPIGGARRGQAESNGKARCPAARRGTG